MALLNNPYIIDIIIGLFLIIYTFIGYLKGFIIRLYDFFSLFIAYFLTINFSFPLSKLITLYQLEGLLEPIGIKVNQLLVAVILFIVGYFILKGIGVLLKPFLKKIVSLLKMTKLLDHLLGLILSIIEGIIIVYFVLSMIFIPFINQGKETIEQTYIGSFIIDTMPHYFSSIADFKDLNQLIHLDVSLSDEKQVSMVTNFIEEASQNKHYVFLVRESARLDDETIKDFIYNYYSEIDLQTVDQEDYQRISSLCQNYDIDINLLTKGH